MAYFDNLPPGCTTMDIERQAGVDDEDEDPRVRQTPGLDPELWDERDGAASERAVSHQALTVLRQMMGLPPLPANPVN